MKSPPHYECYLASLICERQARMRRVIFLFSSRSDHIRRASMLLLLRRSQVGMSRGFAFSLSDSIIFSCSLALPVRRAICLEKYTLCPVASGSDRVSDSFNACQTFFFWANYSHLRTFFHRFLFLSTMRKEGSLAFTEL